MTAVTKILQIIQKFYADFNVFNIIVAKGTA